MCPTLSKVSVPIMQSNILTKQLDVRNRQQIYDELHTYDTRCYFNVRSKANMSQLNLPHLDELSVISVCRLHACIRAYVIGVKLILAVLKVTSRNNV